MAQAAVREEALVISTMGPETGKTVLAKTSSNLPDQPKNLVEINYIKESNQMDAVPTFPVAHNQQWSLEDSRSIFSCDNN
jgi:hypothetical protein